MRTTVEIPDDIRGRLLELAARRGEKGFSRIVAEALTRYLVEEDARAAQLDAALDAIGALDDDEAEALRASVETLRSRWR